MPVRITNFCNNCGVCEIICPYNAIYKGGSNWRKIQNRYFVYCDEGLEYDMFWSKEHFYVVPDKCTECIGKYPEPICMAACTRNCCIIDGTNRESEEQKKKKKEYLESLSGNREQAKKTLDQSYLINCFWVHFPDIPRIFPYRTVA